MARFPTVRVAAVQAAPVVLDVDASVEKACGLLHRAKEAGAQLVALPECFLSLYPSWQWGGEVSDGKREAGELWLRLWESSVDVPGPHVDRLVATCAELDLHCVLGVNERESARPGGSLYNTLLHAVGKPRAKFGLDDVGLKDIKQGTPLPELLA